jgi:AMP nucleosidase
MARWWPERNTRFLRDRFEAFAKGETPTRPVRATYPFVRITTSTHARLDSRLSYGFVAGPGVHETTVTRPDLFHAYLTEQIGLLIGNHSRPVEIGESSEPIPIHFAYRRDINIEAALFSSGNSVVDRPLRDVFDTPDLAAMDDAIANGTLQLPPGASEPLPLFRAARVDYSLHRLYHYTGTDPEHFQNFVIFTNYQFYVDVFARLCRERMGAGQPGLDAFVEPGNVTTRGVHLGGGTTGCPRAHATNAGLPSRRTRLSRHLPYQHRNWSVQCPHYYRPCCRAAAARLADAGALCGPRERTEAR